MKKLLLVPDDIIAYPLYIALEKNIFPHEFEIKRVSSDQAVEIIGDGESVYALLDLVSIGKLPGKLWFLPGIMLNILKKSLDFFLFFKKNVPHFENVALTGNPTQNILAKIIIHEKFDMEANFHIQAPDVSLLEKFDAVLLTGKSAVNEAQSQFTYFDLIEEWWDMKEQPFPYYCWVSTEPEIRLEVPELFKKALILGQKYEADIAENTELHPDLDWLELYRFFTDHLDFNFKEDLENVIKEIWSYAFYYGDMDYIPEVKYTRITEND
ncbi:MAG: hypothetical protein Kow00108_08020 [Calditrichia bacterium]